jgi:MFS transporter, PPP family, 3-phenylpropionic acid transporter
VNLAVTGLPVAVGRAPWTLRILFLAIGAWSAALGPFAAVILRSYGLDTVTIGLLSAVAALAATAIVPAWGHLGDVLVGRVYSFQLAIVIAAACAITLLLPLPVAVLAPTLVSFTLFPAMFLALGNALAVGALPSPERQYGALRALASLSFAVGVIVAGLVYDQAGYAAAPVVVLAWSVALSLLLARVPDRTREPAVREAAAAHGGDTTGGRFGSISRAVALQPRLWPVLGFLALAYTGILGATIFVGIRIVELGGQPSDVALTFGIGSFAEIPGLVLAGWMTRRVGLRWLILVACVAYGLCIALWGVLPTPIAINATRVVTGLCFGALAAALVLVIARLLPAALQATGQTMVQAATFGLGSAAGAVVGGVLYGALGPTAFFAISGALAIVGGIGAWLALYGPVGARVRPTKRIDGLELPAA